MAPEHLLVCKAVFDRGKDWLDIEGMLAVTEGLRLDEVRRWLNYFVGADDQRYEHFEQVVEGVFSD